MLWVSPLQPAEGWSGSAMVPQTLGKDCSSWYFLPLQASILLQYWHLSLLCVLVEFLAVGCGPTEDWICNQLSNSSSASLIPHSLLTAFCSSASGAGSPPPGHTFCRKVCHQSLPQEKGLGTSISHNSALQPLHSAPPIAWRHWPLLV